MSKIRLGNIQIFEGQLPLNNFIVGDVVDDGGYIDPAIITDPLELYRKFRYAKNYESYKKLLESGAILALGGNLKDLNDIPTCAVFNDGEIHAANPKYEDLFKNLEVLIPELIHDSYVINSEEQLSNGGSVSITGYKKSLQFTYRIRVKPKVDNLAQTILQNILQGKVYTLVLPTKPDSSEVTESHNYGVLFQNSMGFPATTDVEYGYEGLSGNLGKVKLDISDTNRDVLNKILGAYIELEGTEIVLKDFYYDNGEYFEIEGYGDDSCLVLETPYPIKFIDFCSQYCDVFSFECDYEYTQKLYYVRGLLNQGLVLGCYSNFANKEGRNINIKFSCLNNWMDLKVYLDEDDSYEYSGREVLADSKNCPLVTFTDLNYYTGESPSYVPEEYFETNSFVVHEHDLDTLYRAYESFFEYDCHPTLMICTHSPSEWRRTPIINIFRNLTKDYLVGGLYSTLMLQILESEEGYISTVTPSIGSDKVFWFSGEFNYPAVYQYIIRWLNTKSFGPEPGVNIIEGSDLADNFHYNGYDVEYKEDTDFILSMSLSNVVNSIYANIYPGISKNSAETVIQNLATSVVAFNPNLDSIVINSIKQVQNELDIDITIYYKEIQKIITINFKIYKYYGTGIA